MTARKTTNLVFGYPADTWVAVEFKDGSYTERSLCRWGEFVEETLENMAYEDDREWLKTLRIAFINETDWKKMNITQVVEVV